MHERKAVLRDGDQSTRGTSAPAARPVVSSWDCVAASGLAAALGLTLTRRPGLVQQKRCWRKLPSEHNPSSMLLASATAVTTDSGHHNDLTLDNVVNDHFCRFNNLAARRGRVKVTLLSRWCSRQQR